MSKDNVTLYKKVGRRYIPVAEYDPLLTDSLPKGSHLVQVYPGGRLTRYNIDPAYAPMIAAGRVAEEAISERLRQASELRPKRKPLTAGQKIAWDNLVKEFGEEARQLEWPSAREACEAAVEAMRIEAEKLLNNPTVRKSFERFLLVCELSREKQDE